MKKPSSWNRADEDWFRGSNGMKPRPATHEERATILICLLVILVCMGMML